MRVYNTTSPVRIAGLRIAGFGVLRAAEAGSQSAILQSANPQCALCPLATRGAAASGLPTDRRFTGEIRTPYIELYQFGARWYSPRLGRFASADTIVPNNADPQTLNRYSYALGNALRYADPTGHMVDDGSDGGGCIPNPYDPDNPCGIPQWQPWAQDFVDEETRTAAEIAYIESVLYPGYFALLYANPIAWEESKDVYYLGIFTEYTEINDWVLPYVRRLNATAFGTEGFEGIENALLANGTTAGGLTTEDQVRTEYVASAGTLVVIRAGGRWFTISEDYYMKLWWDKTARRPASGLIASMIMESEDFEPIPYLVRSRPGQQFYLLKAYMRAASGYAFSFHAQPPQAHRVASNRGNRRRIA